ncbi:MAG TPA: hypothetical protein GYA05_05250 [Acholeplasmataceae bacterium]|jgi:hypothetical protein|nr:hypothetical protein [Acholeplasmataceae bacterium]
MKKHKLKKIVFGIIGLAVIPVHSILLSLKGPYDDLLERLIIVTFSQIGARYGAIEDLIIWGLLFSFYYFFVFDYLLYLSDTDIPILKLTLAFSGLSVLIIVFLPFAPTMFPIASETHNTLSYIAGGSILLTLLIFNLSFWSRDRKLFIKSFSVLFAGVAVLLTVMVTVGVSSLFQILLSGFLGFYMFLELVFLEKSEKIDVFRKLRQADGNDDL